MGQTCKEISSKWSVKRFNNIGIEGYPPKTILKIKKQFD